MVGGTHVATYEALRAVLQHEEPAYIETLKRDMERARMEAEDIRVYASVIAAARDADPLDEMETTTGETDEEEEASCVLCGSMDGNDRNFSIWSQKVAGLISRRVLASSAASVFVRTWVG